MVYQTKRTLLGETIGTCCFKHETLGFSHEQWEKTAKILFFFCGIYICYNGIYDRFLDFRGMQ